ncbi:hypothetical protein PR048_013658 [Dryococelus australis]|uniref:Uncharacterized protein n=1 Tax=Dryococelus australis TaxID=614101 RepID=A0ABQ9HST6_9NEOP|nr:hypothetical protein PR048_013658 [Dryococelus australis]
MVNRTAYTCEGGLATLVQDDAHVGNTLVEGRGRPGERRATAGKERICHVLVKLGSVPHSIELVYGDDEGTPAIDLSDHLSHGKIDVKHVYTEVDFVIGSQFMRHALDDSEPIADLQGNNYALRQTTVTDTKYIWTATGLSCCELRPAANILTRKPWRTLPILACIPSLFHCDSVCSETPAYLYDSQTETAGMQERGKREIPEKTRRPAASSGTIPRRESNPVRLRGRRSVCGDGSAASRRRRHGCTSRRRIYSPRCAAGRRPNISHTYPCEINTCPPPLPVWRPGARSAISKCTLATSPTLRAATSDQDLEPRWCNRALVLCAGCNGDISKAGGEHSKRRRPGRKGIKVHDGERGQVFVRTFHAAGDGPACPLPNETYRLYRSVITYQDGSQDAHLPASARTGPVRWQLSRGASSPGRLRLINVPRSMLCLKAYQGTAYKLTPMPYLGFEFRTSAPQNAETPTYCATGVQPHTTDAESSRNNSVEIYDPLNSTYGSCAPLSILGFSRSGRKSVTAYSDQTAKLVSRRPRGVRLPRIVNNRSFQERNFAFKWWLCRSAVTAVVILRYSYASTSRPPEDVPRSSEAPQQGSDKGDIGPLIKCCVAPTRKSPNCSICWGRAGDMAGTVTFHHGESASIPDTRLESAFSLFFFPALYCIAAHFPAIGAEDLSPTRASLDKYGREDAGANRRWLPTREIDLSLPPARIIDVVRGDETSSGWGAETEWPSKMAGVETAVSARVKVADSRRCTKLGLWFCLGKMRTNVGRRGQAREPSRTAIIHGEARGEIVACYSATQYSHPAVALCAQPPRQHFLTGSAGEPQLRGRHVIDGKAERQFSALLVEAMRDLMRVSRSSLALPQFFLYRVYFDPYHTTYVTNPPYLAPGFSYVGIVPDDGTGRRVFSGISRFPCPFIPALLHTHLASLLSTLKTSMLRATQISSLPPYQLRVKLKARRNAILLLANDYKGDYINCNQEILTPANALGNALCSVVPKNILLYLQTVRTKTYAGIMYIRSVVREELVAMVESSHSLAGYNIDSTTSTMAIEQLSTLAYLLTRRPARRVVRAGRVDVEVEVEEEAAVRCVAYLFLLGGELHLERGPRYQVHGLLHVGRRLSLPFDELQVVIGRRQLLLQRANLLLGERGSLQPEEHRAASGPLLKPRRVPQLQPHLTCCTSHSAPHTPQTALRTPHTITLHHYSYKLRHKLHSATQKPTLHSTAHTTLGREARENKVAAREGEDDGLRVKWLLAAVAPQRRDIEGEKALERARTARIVKLNLRAAVVLSQPKEKVRLQRIVLHDRTIICSGHEPNCVLESKNAVSLLPSRLAELRRSGPVSRMPRCRHRHRGGVQFIITLASVFVPRQLGDALIASEATD